ncbi:hypothetical protein RIF29_37263 [Crotalaria pallida]|uniref:Uncharacterized protein n=1 Tax=Crotalaria pallida TaxID=3830 RepID=A0AAN9EIS8_CROPI
MCRFIEILIEREREEIEVVVVACDTKFTNTTNNALSHLNMVHFLNPCATPTPLSLSSFFFSVHTPPHPTPLDPIQLTPTTTTPNSTSS